MTLAMEPTRWWLVRHAPVAAPPGTILGQADVAADLSDEAMALRLAARLPSGATWIASPLRRTWDTAAALAPAAIEIVHEPDFREQHFGDWQGLTHGEVAARYPDEAVAFWAAPMRNAPPSGEAFPALVARVGAALVRHSARFSGRDLVAVVHDGTIRAALCVALGCPPESVQPFRIDTLSLTRIDHLPLEGGASAWRVMGVNLAG